MDESVQVESALQRAAPLPSEREQLGGYRGARRCASSPSCCSWHYEENDRGVPESPRGQTRRRRSSPVSAVISKAGRGRPRLLGEGPHLPAEHRRAAGGKERRQRVRLL